MDRKPLTLKQRKFVEEYAGEGNAVQAYFRAFGRRTSKGKSRTYWGASKAAARLLQNDTIKSEIESAQAVYAAKTRTSRLRVVKEVAALAFADPYDLYCEAADGSPTPRPWSEVPPAARKAIASVKVKRRRQKDGDIVWEVEEVEYKFHSKTDALDKLCRKLGFYKDEPTATGDTSGDAADLARLVALLNIVKSGGSDSTSGGSRLAVESVPGSADAGLPEPS